MVLQRYFLFTCWAVLWGLPVAYAGVLLARPSSRGDLQRETVGVILSVQSLWRPCSEQHGSSHHHQVSILGLVYHRFLPGAEVHRTLFTRLDFNLNAGNHCRRILTFWRPIWTKVAMVSHLPWATLTALCLLAITQSLVSSSNKWSHCSTRSPWSKQENIHIQEPPLISHWHKPFNDFPHQHTHIPSVWGPRMLCGTQWCCQSSYWLKYLQRHRHVASRGSSRSPSCPDLWGRCTEPSAWSWPPPPCRQPSGWGRADALLAWNRSCGI